MDFDIEIEIVVDYGCAEDDGFILLPLVPEEEPIDLGLTAFWAWKKSRFNSPFHDLLY